MQFFRDIVTRIAAHKAGYAIDEVYESVRHLERMLVKVWNQCFQEIWPQRPCTGHAKMFIASAVLHGCGVCKHCDLLCLMLLLYRCLGHHFNFASACFPARSKFGLTSADACMFLAVPSQVSGQAKLDASAFVEQRRMSSPL